MSDHQSHRDKYRVPILNKRNSVLEALMQGGQPGSQSGHAQVSAGPDGRDLSRDGMWNALMQMSSQQPQNALAGTQSGPADYNYPYPINHLLDGYLRLYRGLPGPDAPEWAYEQSRVERGY